MTTSIADSLHSDIVAFAQAVASHPEQQASHLREAEALRHRIGEVGINERNAEILQIFNFATDCIGQGQLSFPHSEDVILSSLTRLEGEVNAANNQVAPQQKAEFCQRWNRLLEQTQTITESDKYDPSVFPRIIAKLSSLQTQIAALTPSSFWQNNAAEIATAATGAITGYYFGTVAAGATVGAIRGARNALKMTENAPLRERVQKGLRGAAIGGASGAVIAFVGKKITGYLFPKAPIDADQVRKKGQDALQNWGYKKPLAEIGNFPKDPFADETFLASHENETPADSSEALKEYLAYQKKHGYFNKLPPEALQRLFGKGADLTEEQARALYNQIDATIPDAEKLFQTDDCLDTALAGSEMRNHARVFTRSRMIDQEEVHTLQQRDLEKYGTTDLDSAYILGKYAADTVEATCQRISRSSQRTNTVVNLFAGLYPLCKQIPGCKQVARLMF